MYAEGAEGSSRQNNDVEGFSGSSVSMIQKGDNDTSVMIGLYNLHKYEAIGKGNKKVDDKMVTKATVRFDTANNVNNHISLPPGVAVLHCSVVMYDACQRSQAETA